MATYDVLAKQLNDAAQLKDKYAKELLSVAEAFTREVERVWESGGNIQFGRLAEDGTFVPNQIGALSDNLTSEFVIAVRFEVDFIPGLQKFPVAIRKTRTEVQMSVDPSNIHAVTADQPSSFYQAINNLSGVAHKWVDGEVQKSRL